MAGGTGIRTVTGGVSSSNPAEKLLEKVTDFSRHVVTTSGSVTSYGDYPETVADVESFSATTPSDNDVILTTADVSGYTAFYVISTGGSFSVQATLDGTNYSGDLKLENLEGTTATSKDYVNTSTAGVLYRVVCQKAVYLRILANGVTTVANGSLLKGND